MAEIKTRLYAMKTFFSSYTLRLLKVCKPVDKTCPKILCISRKEAMSKHWLIVRNQSQFLLLLTTGTLTFLLHLKYDSTLFRLDPFLFFGTLG